MTAQEQLLLELINRGRSDPAAEAARFGIALNAGLSAGTISATEKQPLAPNQFLVNAAGSHSQDMLDRDYFSHTNLAGQSPSDRARAAGYSTGVGENIAWGGSTGSINQNAHVYARHESLFRSAGHRRNMLSAGYREIGTGVRYGVYTTGGRGYNASMVTEKFGNAGGNHFITGVVFSDAVNANNFYNIGEGIGSGTITATRNGGGQFETQLGASGGYTLQVPDGTYTVSFSGTSQTFNVIVSGANEKQDFNMANLPGPSTPPPTPDPPAPDPPAQDPSPAPGEFIADDSDSGFQQQGSWSLGGIAGAHQGGYRYRAAGSGSNSATWLLENLASGNYEVFATWIAHGNRASNAEFTVFDGNSAEHVTRVDQRVAPNDDSSAGSVWASLGIVAIENGSLRVELSDDANGFVIADAIRIVSTTAAPTNTPPADPPADPPQDPPASPPPSTPTSPIVVDDSSHSFQVVGSGWGQGGIIGAYGGGYQFHRPGDGSNRVRWTVNNLAAGEYDVWTTWVAHENRATNAAFTVRDGSTVEQVVLANQQAAPADETVDNRQWARLGSYQIDNGELSVELSDAANGVVIADAIRIAPADSSTTTPPPPPASETLVDDGDASFQQLGQGWRRGGLAGSYGGDYQFHAAGNGSNRVRWSFGGVTNGSYEVLTTWTPYENRASNAPFTIYDGATHEQTVLVNQRQGPAGDTHGGRPWHSLGTFVIDNGSLLVELSDDSDGFVIADAVRIVTATPAPPAPSNPDQVLDDADTGYAEIGSGWRTGGLAGANQGDYRFHLPGSGGNRARWSFSNLAAGQYQVFGTWVAYANRASNAPFRILDGATVETTVRANQRVGPSDATIDGQAWSLLGTFQIDSGTLTVELSDDANGIIIADAIRVRPV